MNIKFDPILGAIRESDSAENGSAGGSLNALEVIEVSGIWVCPKSGIYKITCIGGGGAGGSIANYKGGGAGGFTSFGGDTAETSLVNAPGGGGGAAARQFYPGANGSTTTVYIRLTSGGAGGGAGYVIHAYLQLIGGVEYPVFIGAGGIPNSSPTVNGADAICISALPNGQLSIPGGLGDYMCTGGAGFVPGEHGAWGVYSYSRTSSGSSVPSGGSTTTETYFNAAGGHGGHNGTSWGTGGVGACNNATASNARTPSSGNAVAPTARTLGGTGGNGAILIEYYLAS